MSKQKVLFISHEPFSTVGNNGKTFLSLFNEFDTDEVGLLYSERLHPESTKFNNYYRITDFNILKQKIPFSRYKLDGQVELTQPETEVKQRRNSRVLFNNFKLDPVIKFGRNLIFSSFKITGVDSFNSWMDDFKPTVIFFVGSAYVYNYKLLENINRKYKIPYYIYFTDDYFLYNKGVTALGKYLHKRFVKITKKIVEGAEELFVISPKMNEEYSRYFNKECSILINAVDKNEIQPPKSSLKNPVIFRYFGWLHSSRSQSLGYLGKCLEYVNLHNSHVCTLEVYSLSLLTDESKADLNVNTIQVLDPIMGEVFNKTLNSSDFLVHAESFDSKDTQVTMLSVSTKIPEYLLSNRCIVAVGPSYLASVNLLVENDLAVVLSGENIVTDAQKLIATLDNMETYHNYCENAIEYCRRVFNSKIMKSRLRYKLLKQQ